MIWTFNNKMYYIQKIQAKKKKKKATYRIH